jgi:hypothetical protein
MDDNIDPVNWEEDINDILSDTFEEEAREDVMEVKYNCITLKYCLTKYIS